MAKCMNLHSADALKQDVKASVLNLGRLLSNGNELQDYLDTMNKILFIENGMINKDKECCQHHHKHDCGGSSIVSILKTDEKGLIDYYTITYSDGRTSMFQIKNGSPGPAGPEGPRGDVGLRGKVGESIYDVAIRNGFTGTEEEFINKLFEKVVTSKAYKDLEYEIDDPSIDHNVKWVPQELTKDQQWQARTNINAFDADQAIIWEGVDIAEKLVDDWDLIVKYTPQFMSPEQKAQARINIGVADEERVRNLEKAIALLDAGDITSIGDIDSLDLNIPEDIVDRGFDVTVVESINVVNKVSVLNKDNIGDLDNLHTDNRDTLVDAINELADLCYEMFDIDFTNEITW